MSKQRTTSLTRPQRKALFTATMWIAWLGFGLVFGVGSYAHRLVFTSPGTDTSTRQFGRPTILTINETITHVPGTPTSSVVATWTWHPLNMLILAIILCAAGVLCRIGYAQLMKSARMPNHLCDECGYDLTGISSSHCPECGSQRTSGAT